MRMHTKGYERRLMHPTDVNTATSPSNAAQRLDDGVPPAVGEQSMHYVGLVTRTISWAIDLVVINLVAVLAGLGVALVLSFFHLPKDLPTILEAIGGAVYVIWCAGYFIVLWTATGQTLGSRLMRIRLVTEHGGRLKPRRALLRWIGMNLAAIPLFAGFIPILFDRKRRGFADWLARTVVIEAPQPSDAVAQPPAIVAARLAQNGASAQPEAGSSPVGAPSADGAEAPRSRTT
jgi:uncharacterized RDD family membrane protein YckC